MPSKGKKRSSKASTANSPTKRHRGCPKKVAQGSDNSATAASASPLPPQPPATKKPKPRPKQVMFAVDDDAASLPGPGSTSNIPHNAPDNDAIDLLLGLKRGPAASPAAGNIVGFVTQRHTSDSVSAQVSTFTDWDKEMVDEAHIASKISKLTGNVHHTTASDSEQAPIIPRRSSKRSSSNSSVPHQTALRPLRLAPTPREQKSHESIAPSDATPSLASSPNLVAFRPESYRPRAWSNPLHHAPSFESINARLDHSSARLRLRSSN